VIRPKKKKTSKEKVRKKSEKKKDRLCSLERSDRFIKKEKKIGVFALESNPLEESATRLPFFD
jgi:hypothetical protein